MNDQLLTITADIVSAHVGNNTVSSGDMPMLIKSVHDAFASLGQVEQVDETQAPAVSVRGSVRPETITCLECGAKQKTLKRHLSTSHALTPADYRAKWNFKGDYPMVAPEYARRRSEMAKALGLGRKAGHKPTTDKTANRKGATSARASEARKAARRALPDV